MADDDLPERIPFQITTGSEAYSEITRLPVTILLENIRSAYNVGSFFRTADAARVERLILTGISSCPPHKGVVKTALGAEDTVRWEHHADALPIAQALRASGHELAVLETSMHSVDIFDWVPRFPVCLIFGNEHEGVSPALIEACDTHVRIPMLGLKHSLNVATAGGIAIFELLRKYRDLFRYTESLGR